MCEICYNVDPMYVLELTLCDNVRYIPDKYIHLDILNFNSNGFVKQLPKTLINLHELHCENSQLSEIPKELINLHVIDCSGSHVLEIPNELINLVELYCDDCQINSIPKELINLRELYCSNTNISNIPKELINLEVIEACDTYIQTLPKELVNLTTFYYSNDNFKYLPKNLKSLYYIHNEDSDEYIEGEYDISVFINKTIIAFKLGRIFRLKKQLPTLWKIADYYTKQKYHPENMYKYI